MDWHALEIKEVFSELKTSEKGLKDEEAHSRINKYGHNEIREIKSRGKILLFLSQFNSLLVYVLIAAGVVSFLIGHKLDAMIIGIIVIINSVIGFIQEYKAEEIIEKLKKSLDYNVIVLRNDKQKEISSKMLVPGDIVILNEGDKVLADCRLIKKNNLAVNESALTGESFPVSKNEDVLKRDFVLSERKNMVYAGTSIVKGRGLGVVVNTGAKTEFGNLAELVQTTGDEKMPLEEKIDRFSKDISIGVGVFVLVLFLIGIYAGFDKMQMFLVAVSLAVGAIPEGLPTVIAITLAIAIKRMHKSNTLIRRLPAAETLGRATIICTDKTGTLTEEELSVDKIYAEKDYSLNSKTKLNNNIHQVLKIGILCNNARDEKEHILGDPTEIALIKSAKVFGLDKKEETEKNPRVKEFSFSSERKIMSIIRKDGKIKTSYVKGAPSLIVERCKKEYINGKIKLLTKERKKELVGIYSEMENSGLRVLGFGFRNVTKVTQQQAENQLIFGGFQGMIDLPRKEVKDAIKDALDAGIKVKIITGDSALTTRNIAYKIGLNGDLIEGKDLDKLDEEKWSKIVKEKTIFARVTPQQKLMIVEKLKEQHETVAVTGDGINDILALKKADIGVSMGIRGTDAARDASDIVLMDDNFTSIIKAVKEGRRVYDNLKKSVKFLLAANLGEVLVVFFALLLGITIMPGLALPFLPLAILWMNLVTDSLPALALAVEPADENVMKSKPRDDHLLTGIWQWVLIAGFLSLACSLGVFIYALNNYSLEIARTMAVSTAIFFELFFALPCKTKSSLFKKGVFDNKWLVYSILVSAGLHLLVVYTPLTRAFGFVSLSLEQLGVCIGLGLSSFIVFEGLKLVKN